jgi:nitrogen fixation/metabolism regulation signal transduction histidine kinase
MAKNKYKRENYLISKEIQGAYMVSFLIPLTLMLLIMSSIFVFALRNGISLSVGSIDKEVNEKYNDAIVMMNQDNPRTQGYKEALEEIRSMLGENDSKINRDRNINAIIKSMMYILIPGLLLAIIELVFLTVFFSHKVAGPVFRLEIACKRVIDGDYKEEIHLRDGDKMGNLALLFNQMTKVTRERLQKAIELESKEEKEEFRTQNKLNP